MSLAKENTIGVEAHLDEVFSMKGDDAFSARLPNSEKRHKGPSLGLLVDEGTKGIRPEALIRRGDRLLPLPAFMDHPRAGRQRLQRELERLSLSYPARPTRAPKIALGRIEIRVLDAVARRGPQQEIPDAPKPGKPGHDARIGDLQLGFDFQPRLTHPTSVTAAG